jgi:hypothetical protein
VALTFLKAPTGSCITPPNSSKLIFSGVIQMTIETCHPMTHSISSSLFHDVITYARTQASAKAEDAAISILPIIMPSHQWNEIWEFEWKAAFDYATEGLTTQELYGHVAA